MWGLFEEVDAGYEYMLCLVSIHATKQEAMDAYEPHPHDEYYVVELKAGQTFVDIEKECGFYYTK